MLWLIYSLACPLVTGIGNIFDKIATEKYSPDVRAFSALRTLPFAVVSTIILFFHPPSGALMEGFLAGILLTVSYIAYFRLFRETEVSRAAGLIYIFPIFTALGAAIFFHEKISALQLFGIFITVSGAVILSMTGLSGLKKKIIILGLAVALTEAAAELLQKSVMQQNDPYATLGLLGISFGVSSLLTTNPKTLIKTAKTKAFPFAMASGVFLILSWLTFILALQLAPISIVAAICAIQPLMVLIMAVIITKMGLAHVNEVITKEGLLQKAAGILLTVIGVACVVL